ncbi:MAG: FtsW/RodA/SpoVE family cell cycle protein [Treponema sp.]|nr:FtsW/RodA/SpoVE family cell cycle protein [Treponema sp.]
MLDLGRKETGFRYDLILLASIILLTLLGLVTLYSASYQFALNQPWRFKDGWTPIAGNVAACAIMIVIFPILALIRLDSLRTGWAISFLVAVTVLLNIFPLLPFFQKGNFDPAVDVRRWIMIRIGGSEFSFQPSEMIKVVLPLYLAYILEKNADRQDNFFYGPLPPAFVTGVFGFLVIQQSNFSEAVLIVVIGLTVCFVAGIRLGWFALGGVLLSLILYQLIWGDPGGRWYQRIYRFFNPSGGISQSDTSMEAVRSGGFFGRGIGQGVVKTRVPEVHGDFVFASYVEEFGLVGVFVHLALLAVFSGIVFFLVWRGRDRFARLLSFGLVTPIVMQTLFNVIVVAGVIPTTGMALPFVSSGGSSMLMTLCASALLVNLARRQVLSPEGERYDAW